VTSRQSRESVKLRRDWCKLPTGKSVRKTSLLRAGFMRVSTSRELRLMPPLEHDKSTLASFSLEQKVFTCREPVASLELKGSQSSNVVGCSRN
jgi:hypothetical protein